LASSSDISSGVGFGLQDGEAFRIDFHVHICVDDRWTSGLDDNTDCSVGVFDRSFDFVVDMQDIFLSRIIVHRLLLINLRYLLLV